MICQFAKNDDTYCETHRCRIDGIDVPDDEVVLDCGRDIVFKGPAARRHRQVIAHMQSLGATPAGAVRRMQRCLHLIR